jgi:hypothetical protein
MSAPDYKTTNPSIDGTTVNNGQQGSSNYARNGKASSPTGSGSEELNRYVTDDTPRERKAPAVPVPGVMVCPTTSTLCTD